jgi:hypothetical protein
MQYERANQIMRIKSDSFALHQSEAVASSLRVIHEQFFAVID